MNGKYYYYYFCCRTLLLFLQLINIYSLGDGLILTKLINYGYPDTIDESKINKGANMSIYQKQENLNMVLAGAKAIGVQLVNIGGQDIIAGR